MSYIGKTPTAVPLTSSDVADDIITLAKMAGGTDGNVITYDASGNPVAVATGTDGQVLTSTGAGSPPAFEDASGGANTPFFLANVTTAQTLASGTSTKITGFADIYDTSSTFASDRFTPGVAGYYYLEASVSLNLSAGGQYLQAQIYKNGALIAWSIQIPGGADTTLTTVSIIDLADDDDYYEVYGRQNSGGSIGINASDTARYTKFLGYKLIT